MDQVPDDLRGEYLRTAWIVMNRESRPLRPKDVIDLAKRDRLLSDKLAGKTPHFTLHAKICMHIKKYGERSTFVRTAPGIFYLRARGAQTVAANPRKVLKGTELVLTFEASLLEEIKRFQGVNTDWRSFHKLLVDSPARCRYMPRLDAETSEGWKQVLTYVMVTRRDEVLAFQRGAYNRTEEYLRGAVCVGFGGHVNERDSGLFDPLGALENARRELKEELHLPHEDRVRLEEGKGLEFVGVLNDDSSPVGQKHFAFLFRYEVSNDPQWDTPKKGEQSINQPRWLTSSASGGIPIWIFEYWSQLCLATYFPELIQTLPTFRVLHRAKLSAPHVLCIVGAIGSGKSEATNILKRDFAYTEINTGVLVAGLIGIPPVPETPREDFCRQSLEFISKRDGARQLAAAIEEKIHSSGCERILVDGIRHKRTLSALRERLEGRTVVVMHVVTLPHIAFEFYRDREKGDLTIFDFLGVRHLQVESEVDSLLEESDVVLYNSMGIEHYTKLIRDLMKDLGIQLGEDNARGI
jgi:predicted NUDIX family phosphoesterase/dephospho-CoA kinase